MQINRRNIFPIVIARLTVRANKIANVDAMFLNPLMENDLVPLEKISVSIILSNGVWSYGYLKTKSA